MKHHGLKLMMSLSLLAMLFLSTVASATTTVVGNGRQSRGYPGHNAEIHGDLFSLPAAATITAVDGRGASGFWIERESGAMVRNFDSLGEAQGYSLPAGRYRVIPNIRDGVNSCGIAVTFTCP